MWGKQSHREALRDRSDSSVTGERCVWCRKPTCAPSSLTRRVRTQSRTLLCCGVVKRVVSHNRVPRWMQLHPSVEPIGSKSSRLTGRRACSVGTKPEACGSVSYVRARLVQKRRAAFERTFVHNKIFTGVFVTRSVLRHSLSLSLTSQKTTCRHARRAQLSIHAMHPGNSSHILPVLCPLRPPLGPSIALLRPYVTREVDDRGVPLQQNARGKSKTH